MKYISGLEEIIADYDALILDIWGTLHNGEVRFPGVLDALQNLQDSQKTVGLLSNSPSRVASVAARLEETYGIPRSLYHAVHNSGENSYLALRDRNDEWHARLGQKYYFIHAPSHERNYIDLPYQQSDLEHADFIVITRTLDYDETIQDYEVQLEEANDRRLPMLCANPDRVVGIGDTLFICPGTVAEFYQTMGGDVFYHGKPFGDVYKHMHKLLGTSDKKRILAVGDAFETDIRGGNRFGCDTLLLTDGIHAKDINSYQPMPDLERLAGQYDAQPTFVTDQLRW